MHIRGRVRSGLLAVVSFMFAMSAAAEVYKWVGPDGTVHFSDQADSPKAEKVEVTPPEKRAVLETDDAEAVPAEKHSEMPTETKVDDTTLLKPLKAPSAKVKKQLARLKKAETAEKQKVNETICQLRYGLSCDQLYHWKSKLKADCEQQKTDSCDEPQYFLRNKPPAILFRDFGKPFPTVDNSSKQDLECLLETGFYCYELASDTYCKQNYDVKQCKELRDWVKNAEKRCEDEGKEDCLKRAMAFRPRTGEELNKIRYGTDLAVEQEEVREISRTPSNRDKYIQRLWDIVGQYPGD